MGGMADHTDFQVQDLNDGKLSEKRQAEEFSSTLYANEAIKYLEQAKTDKPFFLYVAFTAPHDPRNPPVEFREMYYRDRPPLPDNFLSEHPFRNLPNPVAGRDEGLATWPRTEEVISDQMCEYYGLITQLDQQVGRVLTALEKSPHSKNTVVIYTADHGLAMGSHGLLGKQNVYEHSMHCPLIIRGPGIPQGESFAQTYILDLYATICDFAKIEKPKNIDSKSLVPIIEGKTDKVRESIFLPYQNNQRAVTDGRWKLHRYPRIDHQLLFDLKNDPHEMHNLANDPKHQVQLESMQALMDDWREKLGDPYPLTIDKPEPKKATYDINKRNLDKWQPKWIRDKYFDGREYQPKAKN